MTADEQVDLWVEGKAVCPNENDECCPDFSCCQPDLLAPLEEREAFKRADEDARFAMLFTFLGRAMEKHYADKKVYIAGDPATGDTH